MLSDVSRALAAPFDAALTPTKATSKATKNTTPPVIAIPALLLASVHKTLDRHSLKSMRSSLCSERRSQP